MLYFNQFLLTKRKGLNVEKFVTGSIGDYSLYTHSNLQVAQNSRDKAEIVLVGYCFDYRNPSFSNKDIIDGINISRPLEEILDELAHLSGVYIVILKNESGLFILTDMCAFREVYYSNNQGNCSIASSPGLLKLGSEGDDPKPESVDEFYQTDVFKSRLIWVGDETSFKGIKRLKPNHYLNLSNGDIVRYFPAKKISVISVEESATKAAAILKGILKAATHRGTIMMGLTAGWDSRVLLAASKELKDEILYFVIKHKNAAFDCSTSEKLAYRFDLNYIQYQYALSFDHNNYKQVADSLPNVNLNYPGSFTFSKFFPEVLGVNGTASEIARLEFGIINDLSGKKFAALAKYPDEAYPINSYDKWIKENHDHFYQMGYSTLDLFYWEEILANRTAKLISEGHAVNRYIFPPFNCRILITTLLSVDPRYRQKHDNQLYTAIVNKLWPETLQEPVNPTFKKRVIRTMQKLGVYNLYRNMFTTGVKFKI